jgi:hypothetical protein
MVASGIVPNLDILQLPGKALYVRPGAKQTPSIRPHISGKSRKFNPKAVSGGHGGLTQLGLEEAHNHGLNTGNTSVVDKVWVYDPSDDRFDPAKSLNAGAAYYAEGRDGAELSVFQHFQDEVPEDQYDKFGLAIYNLGSGTVSRAHECARNAGKTDATWEDLIEGGLDSFLCKGMRENWNPTVKYKEGTEYVSQILQRAATGPA